MDVIDRIKQVGEEKYAFDIRAMDVRGGSDITDFYVIMSCKNDRQMKALAWEIEKVLFKEFHVKMAHLDGELESHWIVMDYGNIIIHIFVSELREVYKLEELWQKGKKIY
ncbi:MAG: Iojap-like protein [uncultured bacterium]|nr:MAG: Iojap-like protein [uncultured bacterium]